MSIDAERTDALSLDDPYTVATTYWHELPDGRIQCDVCPRNCRLREGQRGLCFVRGRVDDQIVLASYGRSSGFCVDPVEKKPLNHFLPGTPVLSFGTAGCNLACRFCQNWDISKSREIDTLADAAGPEDLARAAVALGCRSVAFTYNGPVIFMEYLSMWRRPVPRSVSRPSRSRPATSGPSRGSSSTGTWMPPTSISKGSPRTSTGGSAPGGCSRCSRRSSTSSTRRGCGLRSPTC